jgi:hypothetical protein
MPFLALIVPSMDAGIPAPPVGLTPALTSSCGQYFAQVALPVQRFTRLLSSV